MCSDAPDTRGVNRAAEANAKIAQEALDWYQDEYARTAGQRDAAAATANQVSQAQLTALNKNTALADEYAAYNRETFRPLEKGIVADAQAYDTPERRMQAQAEAQADVERAVTGQRDATMRATRRMGATPSSGRALAMTTALDLGAAKLKAGASQQAVKNVEQQGYARRMDAASLGRNLPGNQATSQSIATTAGNSASSNAMAALNAQQSGAAMMGQGFNTAIQGNQSAGNLYGQAAQIQAQSGADLGGIASLAKAGGYLYSLSDQTKKRKTGRMADGAQALQEVQATPVHDGWEYDPAKGGPDDGGQPHTGPMAQDVQRTMGDDVAPGGTMIDVVNVMGKTLAATQELAKRVGRMEKALGQGVAA
jgi:hypothetical protein